MSWRSVVVALVAAAVAVPAGYAVASVVVADDEQRPSPSPELQQFADPTPEENAALLQPLCAEARRLGAPSHRICEWARSQRVSDDAKQAAADVSEESNPVLHIGDQTITVGK